MLVELSLVNNTEIHDTIDRAWGIVHNKHKKKETQVVPLSVLDPRSKENLSVLPAGQDASRKRYWALDGDFSHSTLHWVYRLMFIYVLF